MRAYIINGCVTRNNLDDISYRGYFVGYTATMGVIIYWKPDQHFVIHIDHNDWFDEYNYCTLQVIYYFKKYPESHVHHS